MSIIVTSNIDDKDTRVECGDTVTIGRAETNDIVISDPQASRSHAMVRALRDGNCYLSDAGSANGTFLNGKRVVVPVTITAEDKVQIGDCRLSFDYKNDAQTIAHELEESSFQRTVIATSVVRKVTILVIDICGYTKMSEEVSEDYLALVMGNWFREANDIVDKNGGVIDQYVGDAIMARWDIRGKEAPATVRSALMTALEMRRVSDRISEEHEDLPAPITIGAGINTGRASVGHVGAGSKRDFTALGDSVNLAFRLEAATRQLGQDLVVGEESYLTLPGDLREGHKQKISVKGKEKPVNICAFTFDEIARWVSSPPTIHSKHP